MGADELHHKVKRRPFESFRIHLSDGTAYDVKHPEQIMVGRRSCYVGIGGNAESPFQSIATVANIRITRIEPLDGGKGKRSSKRSF